MMLMSMMEQGAHVLTLRIFSLVSNVAAGCIQHGLKFVPIGVNCTM